MGLLMKVRPQLKRRPHSIRPTLFSSPLRRFLRSEGFQQVMRHTNQQPFRFDLREPAQEKLTEAAHMLDLRKDRFDDHLSSAEHFPSGLAGQLVPHPFLQRGVCWQRRVLLSIEWLTLIWWHVQIDAAHGLVSNGGSAVA